MFPHQLPEPVEAVEERETELVAARERKGLKRVFVELFCFTHHNRAPCTGSGAVQYKHWRHNGFKYRNLTLLQTRWIQILECDRQTTPT